MHNGDPSCGKSRSKQINHGRGKSSYCTLKWYISSEHSTAKVSPRICSVSEHSSVIWIKSCQGVSSETSHHLKRMLPTPNLSTEHQTFSNLSISLKLFVTRWLPPYIQLEIQFSSLELKTYQVIKNQLTASKTPSQVTCQWQRISATHEEDKLLTLLQYKTSESHSRTTSAHGYLFLKCMLILEGLLFSNLTYRRKRRISSKYELMVQGWITHHHPPWPTQARFWTVTSFLAFLQSLHAVFGNSCLSTKTHNLSCVEH